MKSKSYIKGHLFTTLSSSLNREAIKSWNGENEMTIRKESVFQMRSTRKFSIAKLVDSWNSSLLKKIKIRYLGLWVLTKWGKVEPVCFSGCVSECFELFLTGIITNKMIAEGKGQQVFLFLVWNGNRWNRICMNVSFIWNISISLHPLVYQEVKLMINLFKAETVLQN